MASLLSAFAGLSLRTPVQARQLQPFASNGSAQRVAMKSGGGSFQVEVSGVGVGGEEEERAVAMRGGEAGGGALHAPAAQGPDAARGRNGGGAGCRLGMPNVVGGRPSAAAG